MLTFVFEVQTYLFFSNMALFLGLFCSFWNLYGFYQHKCQCQKNFLDLLTQIIFFRLESTAIAFCFSFGSIWGPFFACFESYRLFLGFRLVSKILSGTTYVDYQLLFWKYSPIFLSLFQPHLGHLFIYPFGTFKAIFLAFRFGAISGLD